MNYPIEKIRICVWATTFQADILTLTRFLIADERFEVLVAIEDPDLFRDEPIQKLLPIRCQLVDRAQKASIKIIKSFKPHLTIVDNHFPPSRLSPALFVLWHGFGWKGPNDRKEFAQVYKAIKKLTGAPADKPNEHFLWQCFGPTDLEHRHSVSGFARENLKNLGSAFTDDLLFPPISRDKACLYYPASFSSGPVVLLAFTWHYGRVFSHWGEDISLFKRLFEHLTNLGCSIILRMHDRHRFEPDYLKQLESLSQQFDNVLLKFKDVDRDSLLDMLISNVMVSNYSSILNYFYATGRPSIHVYPVKSANEAFLWRTFKRGKVRCKKIPSADYIWKLPPEENGGLMAKNFEELLETLEHATSNPECCKTRSREFIATHMAPVDGKTCDRIADVLQQFSTKKT